MVESTNAGEKVPCGFFHKRLDRSPRPFKLDAWLHESGEGGEGTSGDGHRDVALRQREVGDRTGHVLGMDDETHT